MSQSLSAAETYVLITGASSGIGEGFAREFARRGYSLILTARRGERLQKLSDELRAANGIEVRTIAADLAADGGAREIFDHCQRERWRIGGLVNSAGLGINKSFARLGKAQIQDMLGVNVTALVEMTRCFLPLMVEMKKGFVLNIASTAGFQPVPYFSLYAATKSFVLTFSEGLYEELKPRGVLVSCLCPGPVDTEFQQVAGMSPRFFARSQSVSEVVAKGMRALERGQAVAWSSWLQRVSSAVAEISPRSVRRRVAAWLMVKSGAV